MDATTLARNWLVTATSTSRANYGLELAGGESADSGWKKFSSGETGVGTAPVLNITYDHRPSQPTSVGTVPVSRCLTKTNQPYLSTKTPILVDAVADSDSARTRSLFEVAATGNTTAISSGYSASGAPGFGRGWQVPAGVLNEGGTYSWHAQGDDGTVTSVGFPPWCEFIVDTIAPATPTVGAANYPQGGWLTGNPQGTFGFTSPGSTDVAHYTYRFDSGPSRTVGAATGTHGLQHHRPAHPATGVADLACGGDRPGR